MLYEQSLRVSLCQRLHYGLHYLCFNTGVLQYFKIWFVCLVAFQQSLPISMVPAGTLGIGVTHDTVAALGVAQNSLQSQQLQVGGNTKLLR